jgi:hypothetical protein
MEAPVELQSLVLAAAALDLEDGEEQGTKNRKKKKAKKKKAQCMHGNVDMAGAPGCHVAHYDADWIVGVSPFDYDDFGLEEGDEVPDISVDPETKLLTVINTSEECARCYYITLHHRVLGRDGRFLAMGSTIREGKTVPCVTFVLVVGAAQLMDVAYVECKRGQTVQADLTLFSDVSDLWPHPHPDRFDPKHTFAFPLPALDTDGKRRDYLCSQGMCGALTHFFPQTLHAVDFRCPVGTPVLAIGAGVITELSQANTVSGIHVSNLYTWNSLTVRMADNVFVDYVHVKAGSARVAVGDEVLVGQMLCESGEAGFCPEPHLHIQVSLSDDPKAPTEKFAIQAPGGESFIPTAGAWYSASGRIR